MALSSSSVFSLSTEKKTELEHPSFILKKNGDFTPGTDEKMSLKGLSESEQQTTAWPEQ